MEKILETIKQISGVHPARTMSWDNLYAGISSKVDEGLINVQSHPKFEHLKIYKYSQDAVVNRDWDVFTLIARGLILDIKAKKVIATPFTKFFNHGEIDPELKLIEKEFVATEKIDGSMGIIFHYEKEWRTATLGSFDSEQAWYAYYYLKDEIDIEELYEDETHLVEIVYPENKIVVNYDGEGLFLLSVFNDEGIEYSTPIVKKIAKEAGFMSPDIYDFAALDKILGKAKELDANHEGYVIRFASGVRVKVKGDEYCRIHRLISRCTPLAIWDMMLNKDDLDEIRNDLPEELQRDFDLVREILEGQVKEILDDLEKLYDKTKHLTNKELGLEMQNLSNTKYLSGIKNKNTVKFLFARRNKDFYAMVDDAKDYTRRRLYVCVRPIANVLEGYTPTSVVNRFQRALEEN